MYALTVIVIYFIVSLFFYGITNADGGINELLKDRVGIKRTVYIMLVLISLPVIMPFVIAYTIGIVIGERNKK